MKQIFSEIILIVWNSWFSTQSQQVQILKSLGQNSFSVHTVSDIHVLYTLYKWKRNISIHAARNWESIQYV
jgi:hypothetical protein